MLMIGIDEAGYWPLLGPLVVAGTAFRMDGCDDPAAAPSELAKRLKRAIAAPGVQTRGRLRVGDSKQVFGGRREIGDLERPVLAFLACAGLVAARDRAGSLDDVLRAVGADAAERRALPWYAGEPARYPCDGCWDDAASDAAALAERLARVGVEFVGFAAEVVPERRLNEDARRVGNKADALFATTAGVLERLLARRRDAEAVDATLDHQGGRRFYLPLLQPRWPAAFVWALEEEELRSTYRVALADAPVVVRFLVGGDREAPWVGLASMGAKYLREVYMGLFNAWFAGICPDVAPTAGYLCAAGRRLEETREARLAADLPDGVLVRVR